MALELPAFRGGLPAARVDQSLRQALAAFDAARQNALLWFHEILARSLYRELGYASIEQYATEALGFSRNRTWQFLKLARDLDRLPPLREAVAADRLEWTKAQQVGRVATADTARKWVRIAERSGRRELQRRIEAARAAADATTQQDAAGQGALPLGGAAVRTGAATAASVSTGQSAVPVAPAPPSPAPAPAAAPVPAPRVSCNLTFDSLDAARLEAMIEAARKAGAIPAAATREEAVLAAFAALLDRAGGIVRERKSTGRKSKELRRHKSRQSCQPIADEEDKSTPAPVPYRVVLYRCRRCEATEVVGGGGRRRVVPASAEAALENAVLHDAGRNRSAVPPGLRELVLVRDGHRCQAAGCGATRFLEVHHRVRRADGGANEPANLVTLCSRCHRFVHEQPEAGRRLLGSRPRRVQEAVPG